MALVTPDLDNITERVIGCAIEVHRTLGPGLLESIYRDCLVIELREAHLGVETGRRVSLRYKGEMVRSSLELDLVVDHRVVVELKAAERLHPVHQAQVMTYLRLSGCPVGLLMNFNETTLRAGLKRLTHPKLYVPRTCKADSFSRKP